MLPPLILAMISLPQIMKLATKAMAAMTMTRAIILIMRRVLLGFLTFLGGWSFLASCLRSFIGVLLLVSSPLFSSKSKAWMGLKKSAEASGDFLVVLGLGVGFGVGSGVSGDSLTGLVGVKRAVESTVWNFLVVALRDAEILAS